ncbi:hypothetical protein ES702_07011 [subsurface metagenome]
MEDFSLWKIPEEVKVVRLNDKNEIKIPYIIKDRIILKEGIANGIFYPGEELEPCVPVLSAEPDSEDVEARKRSSLFWDHDDACKNWLGEAKNFRWDSEAKAIRADIYLVDEDAAKKTHYQLKEGLSRWGISPRVRIDEKDGRAVNIQFISLALVLEPAGGPKLMLEQETFNCECIECGWKTTSKTHCKDLKCEECGGQMRRAERPGPGQPGEETQDKEPYVAWVCKKCDYSEAVEEDEKDEKTKDCPKCDGEMVQKEEARDSALEELYEDLSLEGEKDSDMEFDRATQGADDEKLAKLAEEFGLTLEEIKRFSPEQLELLNVPAEVEADPQKTYKKPPETEAKKMFVCPKCGHLEPIKAGEKEKECPQCQTPMEIKEVKDETGETFRKQFETFAPIVKVNQDEHVVKMIILEAEVADNQTHVVSEEEIRNAMYHWMENYRKLEVMHRDKAGNLFQLEEGILSPEDEAWRQDWEGTFSILECFQAPTDYFEDDQLVRKGSWILTLRVNDENIWQKIKSKELTGASIGGHGALTSEVFE